MEKFMERIPLFEGKIFHVGRIAKWSEREPVNRINGQKAAISVGHNLTMISVAEVGL
jgi:hypothetical protein